MQLEKNLKIIVISEKKNLKAISLIHFNSLNQSHQSIIDSQNGNENQIMCTMNIWDSILKQNVLKKIKNGC